jgi:hypothetical protein
MFQDEVAAFAYEINVPGHTPASGFDLLLELLEIAPERV